MNNSQLIEILKLDNFNLIYYYIIICDEHNLSVRQLRERI